MLTPVDMDYNGNWDLKSDESDDHWEPRYLKPGSLKYTSKFLGFMSKVRDSSTDSGNQKDKSNNAPNRYVFRNGLYKPRICPNISEIKIPFMAKIFPRDPRINETISEFYNFILDKLSCLKERSYWGFEMKRINVKPCIPCNVDEVCQQHLLMTPIMEYISSNPDVVDRIKPQFVCTRQVLMRIMLLSEPTFSYTFHAEKTDGVIYLREITDTRLTTMNEKGNPANIVTNVILSNHNDGKQTPIDLNEATYGAYVGQIGPDIKILYSAKLDAFWGPLKENSSGEVDSTGLEERIVELKTVVPQRLWPDANKKNWMRVITSTWAQGHLIGSEDAITSVVFGADDVGQILRFKVNKMLENVTWYNGHSGPMRESFFFNRLNSALKTLLKEVVEDAPTVYVANVIQPKRSSKVTTEVRPLTSYFPTQAD